MALFLARHHSHSHPTALLSAGAWCSLPLEKEKRRTLSLTLCALSSLGGEGVDSGVADGICLFDFSGEEIGAAQEEGPVAGSAWRGVFGLPPVAGPERPSMRAGDSCSAPAWGQCETCSGNRSCLFVCVCVGPARVNVQKESRCKSKGHCVRQLME